MPTVAQLKAQLAAKGLPTDGVKAVLEARLAAAVPVAPAPAQVDVAQLASLKRQLDHEASYFGDEILLLLINIIILS